MEYEERTYFVENDYDDVKGFTLLEADSGQYHVGEKWLKDEGDDVWISYWIPESDLVGRVEDGAATEKGKLTDEQFSRVCELVGWRYDQDPPEDVEVSV